MFRRHRQSDAVLEVVGDMAQFLVVNKIPDEKTLLEQVESLSFPTSVVEYFQGYLGQPVGGFSNQGAKSLEGKDIIEGRPDARYCRLISNNYAPSCKKSTAADATPTNALSSAMYPKVFDEYVISRHHGSGFLASN